MYRSVIRTLFVAATLLLTTTACDKGGDAKDAGKGEAKKAEPEVKAEPVKTEPTPTPPVEPVPAPTTGAEPAAETGAPEPAVDEGGDKPEDGGEKDPAPKPVEKDPEPKPEPIAKVDGKPVFESKCKSCHGADGKGDTTIGKKVQIPSLSGTKLAKSKIVSIIEVGVPDTKMKGYKDKLTSEEIDALAVYVGKL